MTKVVRVIYCTNFQQYSACDEYTNASWAVGTDGLLTITQNDKAVAVYAPRSWKKVMIGDK